MRPLLLTSGWGLFSLKHLTSSHLPGRRTTPHIRGRDIIGFLTLCGKGVPAYAVTASRCWALESQCRCCAWGMLVVNMRTCRGVNPLFFSARPDVFAFAAADHVTLGAKRLEARQGPTWP
jgi:hypothetical protein